MFNIFHVLLGAGRDKSGTLTTGGVAQQLAAQNHSRRFLSGQNISAGDLWVSENGSAAAIDTAGSYKVPSGSSFVVSTTNAVSVIGATTGQAWTATEN